MQPKLWIDYISENEGQRKTVNDAIDLLNSVGFFGALLQVASERNKPAPIKVGTEQYALRAAWYDGYADALKDVYQFKDRFVIPALSESPPPKPDFGALTSMLKNKDFNSEEEYQAYLATL